MKQYLLLFLVLHTSAAPFDPADVAECHVVPRMCQISPSYKKMRLPNMFNDTRVKDVERTLEAWKPLFNSTTCNAGNQFKYFLCFTYAPVCVQKLISPCKSLCETVRDSCDPVLRQYNHSWPSYFDCNQPKKFQDDSSQLCISLKMIGLANDACSCKGTYTKKTLKSLICSNDYVFSAWVRKHIKASNQIDVKPSRVFRRKPSLHNLSRTNSVRLELTTTKKPCRCNKLRVKKKARGSGRYLIIASNVSGIMKVKAMKRMEDRQEIARIVRRC